MLVAQVELDGVWSVDGGMHGVAWRSPAWRRRAERRSATASGSTRIAGRPAGGRAACGWPAARLDRRLGGLQRRRRRARRGLLGAGPTRARAGGAATQRSLSALTWSMRARSQGFRCSMPQRLLRRRLRVEFDDIFAARQLPREADGLRLRPGPRHGGAGGAGRRAAAVPGQCTGRPATRAPSTIWRPTHANTEPSQLLRDCGLTLDFGRTSR
jgi:1-hydroxycarotenoid 3,4-desaturase